MVAKVMAKAGATVCAWVMMYKALVQTVFLYGSDIWVVIGLVLMVLEGFCHWVARRIAKNTSRYAGYIGWE